MSISTSGNGTSKGGTKRIGAKPTLDRLERLDFKECIPRDAFIFSSQLDAIIASERLDEDIKARAVDLRTRLDKEAGHMVKEVKKCSFQPTIPPIAV